MVGRDEDKRKTGKTEKLGQYQMGNIIGKGGFGSVFKAFDPLRGQFVAIKQVGISNLNSGDLGSIKLEIALLSKLKHRNIVKYIDSIRTDDHLNIVLEYIEGGSLASILKKFGAFPEPLCAIYTLQLLKGLQYLHLQGVIHRDIKGANVLTTKTGLVKLADFGVAMKLDNDSTKQRRVVGTPYWMAPEIVEMSNPTPACDIWSVGSTVVEMVTEKPPYAELNQVSALYRIVSDPMPPLPEGITRYCESFLVLCFEKNPLRRPSATDLLTDEWIEKFTRHKPDVKSSSNIITSSTKEEPNEDEDGSEDEDETDMEAVAIAEIMNTMNGMEGLDFEPGADKPNTPLIKPPTSSQTPHLKANEISPKSELSPPRKVSIAEADKKPDIGAPSVMGSVLGLLSGLVGAQAPTAAVNTQDVVSLATSTDITQPVLAQSPLSVTGDQTVGESSPFSADNTSDAVQDKLRFAFLDYYEKHYVASSDGSVDECATPQFSDVVCASCGNVLMTDAVFCRKCGTKKDQVGLEPLEENVEIATTRDDRTYSDWEDDVPLEAEAALKLGFKKAISRMISDSRPPAAEFRNGIGNESTPLHPPPGASRMEQRKEKMDAEEIKQLLGSIRPFEEPDVLVGICKRLMELLDHNRQTDNNLHLVTQHGAVPIVEMLQVTDPELLRTVLKVVNQIVEGNQSFQENFAMSGLIPAVLKFARPHHSRPLRYEAACFVSRLCHTSDLSLQMLIACGGLDALVDLVSHDYYYNRDLVWLALEALDKVFESASKQSQKSDFCRILAKHGLCIHLCVLVDTLAGDIHNRAAEYLRIVIKLLMLFAREGDAVVKVYMAKGPVLEGLIASLEFLPPDLTVQIARTFKWLAQEPSVLNMLENAGVVPVLVHFLSLHCAPKDETQDIDTFDINTQTASHQLDPCRQSMLALYFLCKLSRARQEQAAIAGALPLLQELVGLRKDLRGYAFAMICSMTCASLASRKILWDQGGVAFFVRSLSAPDLQTPALEALVDWLSVKEHHADWRARVEGVLLQGGEFIACIVAFFRRPKADASIFVKILDPLLRFLRISRRIRDALASNDEFFQELVNRLKFEHKIGPNALETSASVADLNSIEGTEIELPPIIEALEAVDMGSAKLKSRAPHVRRLVSEPAVSAGVDVRVRMDLLRLLLLLCETQGPEHLAGLCQKYRLEMLMRHVLLEEQRKQRVILCEIAQQLLSLFQDNSAASIVLQDA